MRNKDNSFAYAYFDLSNGTVLSSTATVAGIDPILKNGFRRVYIGDDVSSGVTSPYVLIEAADSDGDKTFTGDNATPNVWIWRANLTQTPYPLPPVYSNGSMTAIEPSSVAVDISSNTTFRAPLSDAVGAATSIFTFICEVTPGADFADYGALAPFVSCQNSAYSILTGDHTTDDFRCDDGTNVAAGPNLNPTRGTKYYVVVRGDSTADGGAGELQVSAATTLAGLAAAGAHGTKVAYDGSFTLGNDLHLGYSNEYPFTIKNIKLYSEVIADADLAKAFIYPYHI